MSEPNPPLPQFPSLPPFPAVPAAPPLPQQTPPPDLSAAIDSFGTDVDKRLNALLSSGFAAVQAAAQPPVPPPPPVPPAPASYSMPGVAAPPVPGSV